jgi:hypothetical protein
MRILSSLTNTKSNALFLQEASIITATESLITNQTHISTDMQRAAGQDSFLGKFGRRVVTSRLLWGYTLVYDGSVLWLSVRLDSPSNRESYLAKSPFKS